ncbi:MAG: hypothetical protein Q9225_004521 [Loekoesia sp. 1 TL-2023]
MRKFFSNKWHSTSLGRKASQTKTPQQDQNLEDDRWPREAVLLDGRLRWRTYQGVGDLVTGDFDYAYDERDDKYLLLPKGWKSAAENPRLPADTGRSSDRQLQKTDHHDVDALADDLAQRLPPGTFQAQNSGSTNSAQDFSRKYLMSLLRNGRKPKGDFIAVDVSGNLDIDHDIDGPEVSPESQMTSAGYLAMKNADELAAKRRKERKRFLAPLAAALGPEMEDEKNALDRCSSISSVSNISITNYDLAPSDDACGPECYLQLHVATELSKFVDSTALTSSHGDPYFELYTYQRILPGQTRVLALEPSTLHKPPLCSLMPMAIDAKAPNGLESMYHGSYEALSYAWGSSKLESSVICDGKRLRITQNLHSALLRLRQADRTRYLWVDAICIDQSNTQERSNQVRQMQDIYRQAQNVIVWLGEKGQQSTAAMAFAADFDDRKLRRAILNRNHQESCHKRLALIFEALVHLLRRIYFRRSWIRQEIAVARKIVVQCGNSSSSWYALKRCAQRLPKIHKMVEKRVPELSADDVRKYVEPLQRLQRGWVYGQALTNPYGEIRSVWYYHAGGLLDLLIVGREFEATDPRDKVYSILGLARVPTETREMLAETPHSTTPSSLRATQVMEIDYSKSVSHVYQDVAKYIINRDRNLDILCILSTHRDKKSSDLPSWVPDWRVPTSHATVKDCWDYYGCKFAAAGFTQAEYQCPDVYDKLVVNGFLVDAVSTLLDVTVETSLHLRQIQDDESFDRYRRPWNASSDLRRLCLTDQQRLCLVPSTAQAGDLIFVLQGAKLPFVLRPRNIRVHKENSLALADEDEFEIVGPCCVPDLMYGRTIKVVQEARVRGEEKEPLSMVEGGDDVDLIEQPLGCLPYFQTKILSAIRGYVMCSNSAVDLSAFAGIRKIKQRSHIEDWIIATSVSRHFSTIGKRAFFSTKTFTITPKLLEQLVTLAQTATPPEEKKIKEMSFCTLENLYLLFTHTHRIVAPMTACSAASAFLTLPRYQSRFPALRSLTIWPRTRSRIDFFPDVDSGELKREQASEELLDLLHGIGVDVRAVEIDMIHSVKEDWRRLEVGQMKKLVFPYLRIVGAKRAKRGDGS